MVPSSSNSVNMMNRGTFPMTNRSNPNQGSHHRLLRREVIRWRHQSVSLAFHPSSSPPSPSSSSLLACSDRCQQQRSHLCSSKNNNNASSTVWVDSQVSVNHLVQRLHSLSQPQPQPELSKKHKEPNDQARESECLMEMDSARNSNLLQIGTIKVVQSFHDPLSINGLLRTMHSCGGIQSLVLIGIAVDERYAELLGQVMIHSSGTALTNSCALTNLQISSLQPTVIAMRPIADALSNTSCSVHELRLTMAAASNDGNDANTTMTDALLLLMQALRCNTSLTTLKLYGCNFAATANATLITSRRVAWDPSGQGDGNENKVENSNYDDHIINNPMINLLADAVFHHVRLRHLRLSRCHLGTGTNASTGNTTWISPTTTTTTTGIIPACAPILPLCHAIGAANRLVSLDLSMNMISEWDAIVHLLQFATSLRDLCLSQNQLGQYDESYPHSLPRRCLTIQHAQQHHAVTTTAMTTTRTMMTTRGLYESFATALGANTTLQGLQLDMNPIRLDSVQHAIQPALECNVTIQRLSLLCLSIPHHVTETLRWYVNLNQQRRRAFLRRQQQHHQHVTIIKSGQSRVPCSDNDSIATVTLHKLLPQVLFGVTDQPTLLYGLLHECATAQPWLV